MSISSPTNTRAGRHGLIEVAIVDDDESVQVAVRMLIESCEALKCGGIYSTASEALIDIPRRPPHVVLLDLRLPDMSGIECARKLSTLLPKLSILMHTGHPDAQSLFRSLMAGASGYLVKPLSPDEFRSAIDEVLHGGTPLSRAVVPFLVKAFHQFSHLPHFRQLSRREQQIIALLFQGLQDKEIAVQLRIGTATVHTHLHRLFEKLGVRSRRDVIAKYLELQGL